MTTIGAIFLPQWPPERLRTIARTAEEVGLEELWLWEDCFYESGIAAASAVLAWTDRLKVGVGLLPVPLRNVALTAMEIATLHRLFPGRPIVGVGHGVQDWMRQVGADVESPVTLLREYLTALRSLLHGEEISPSGRYVNLDRVALDWPPSPAPDVLAGATGPRSLRLCGELADGVILTGSTKPEGVREARGIIDDARGDGTGVPITLYLPVERTGPDAARAAATAVGQMVDAGADKVILEPSEAEPDPEAFIRFAAEVASLIP